MSSRDQISGFVVAYNRADLVATCLRSLRFVDELIVIDKSPTDDTPAVARRYADKVITVPFSPTVAETRSLALAQCQYDWIAFLDDDEMLSPLRSSFYAHPKWRMVPKSSSYRCVTISSARSIHGPTTGPSTMSGFSPRCCCLWSDRA